MTQANLGGLAGAALGGAIGYGMSHVLGTAGFVPLDAIAGGAIAGCFTASMFGLLYDRTPVAEFRKSYKLLTRHLVQGELDPEYDPRERMAFLGIPIAFATIIVPVVAAILWLVVQSAGGHPAIYVVAGVLSTAATLILGNLTTDHRLLDEAPRSQVVEHGEHEGDKLRACPTSAKGRRDAVICILGGFLLLGINHFFAVHDHTYSMKLVFAGPMISMVGLFGLFEPRIMSRHLPIGKTYPHSVLMLMLLAMAIGAAGAYQIDAWYHG
jgi:MFS family permease